LAEAWTAFSTVYGADAAVEGARYAQRAGMSETWRLEAAD
jgi:hypothetical protein